jgi:hypothetical protein
MKHLQPRLLALYAFILLAVNALVSHRLFTLEYSAHLESNEGSFIAISRIMATHPRDLLWWPFWDGGIPFQHTYFPLLHAIVAIFSRLTGYSPALSFHAVAGAFYCLGAVTLFLLAAGISKQPGYSFCAALLYSLVSPANFLDSGIRGDAGGLWNARRLQVLGYYGEGPHITTIAFLPIAVLCIYLALTTRRKAYYLASGLATAAVMLSNAFGTVDLFLAVVCLLALLEPRDLWRGLKTVVAIGGAVYLVVSPIMLPSLLLVIRRNSQIVGGDFRFTARSAAGVAILITLFALCRWLGRRFHLPLHFTFFLLLSVFFAGIPLLAFDFGIFVFPQPHRYQVEFELALPTAALRRRTRPEADAGLDRSSGSDLPACCLRATNRSLRPLRTGADCSPRHRRDHRVPACRLDQPQPGRTACDVDQHAIVSVQRPERQSATPRRARSQQSELVGRCCQLCGYLGDERRVPRR